MKINKDVLKNGLSNATSTVLGGAHFAFDTMAAITMFAEASIKNRLVSSAEIKRRKAMTPEEVKSATFDYKRNICRNRSNVTQETQEMALARYYKILGKAKKHEEQINNMFRRA